MHTTFINYAPDDEVLAKRIYADLLAAGVRPWLLGYDMMPGERPLLASLQALTASQHVIILLTKKSLRDADCLKLTEAAQKHKKTILPVIADMGVKVPTGLPEPIQLKRRYGDAVRDMLSRLPADAEPLNQIPAWQRGNEAYFLTDYEGALESYNQIKEHTATTLNSRAAAYNALRRHAEALEDINRAIELDPQVATFYRNRSLALSGLGRNHEALLDDSKAVELDPDSPQGWSSYAMTLLALNQYDDARESINAAIELEPQQAYYWYQLGIIEDRAGNGEAALAAFDRALQHDPTNTKAIIGRRMTLGHLGRYEEALKDIDREIKRNPRRGNNYLSRSLVNFYMGRYAEAVKDATSAMERGQDNQLAGLFNRAIAHWRLGKTEQAQADFLLAIQLLAELRTEEGIRKNAESDQTAEPAIEILRSLKDSGLLDKLSEQLKR